MDELTCSCKGNCGGKLCGCQKLDRKCSDDCQCAESSCKNREVQQPESTTDGESSLNSTFTKLPDLPKDPPKDVKPPMKRSRKTTSQSKLRKIVEYQPSATKTESGTDNEMPSSTENLKIYSAPEKEADKNDFEPVKIPKVIRKSRSRTNLDSKPTVSVKTDILGKPVKSSMKMPELPTSTENDRSDTKENEGQPAKVAKLLTKTKSKSSMHKSDHKSDEKSGKSPELPTSTENDRSDTKENEGQPAKVAKLLTKTKSKSNMHKSDHKSDEKSGKSSELPTSTENDRNDTKENDAQPAKVTKLLTKTKSKSNVHKSDHKSDDKSGKSVYASSEDEQAMPGLKRKRKLGLKKPAYFDPL